MDDIHVVCGLRRWLEVQGFPESDGVSVMGLHRSTFKTIPSTVGRQQMKVIEGTCTVVKRVMVGAATGLALVAGNAMAVLPTEAATAFTTLSGNVTDIVAAVWPILAAAVGSFVLFKLFRRGMNKI